ncbi:MAG: nitrilase-related carbon-nitrogen hydrolase, partial [Pseudonocardiaceae bacterium]
MRITLAQIDSRPGELDANVARAEQVIAEAVSEDTDLVVFPELSLSGYTIGDIYNSAAYYEDGQLVHVHRKLFLPNYATFEERKHFLPGQSSRAFPIMGGRHRAAT